MLKYPTVEPYLESLFLASEGSHILIEAVKCQLRHLCALLKAHSATPQDLNTETKDTGGKGPPFFFTSGSTLKPNVGGNA